MCASAPRVKVPPVSGKSTRRPKANTMASTLVECSTRSPSNRYARVICECGWEELYPVESYEAQTQECHLCKKEKSEERVQKGLGVLNGLF
jgi:hypothetical protein|tara:strand:- start:2 stop:274 length:273 start_codon:yes stop_codon:yes gene_type:complete